MMVGSMSMSLLLLKEFGAARTWNIPRFHPNGFTECDKFRQNVRFEMGTSGASNLPAADRDQNNSAVASD
jgi:hypothetical protein